MDTAPFFAHLHSDAGCGTSFERSVFISEPFKFVLLHLLRQLFVAVGAQSKWARRRKVTLVELLDEPWILSRPEMQPGGPAFEAFRAIGTAVPRVDWPVRHLDSWIGLALWAATRAHQGFVD